MTLRRTILALTALLSTTLPAAAQSRLATGNWVKISIPATGFYQLSDSLLLAAGFSDPQRVRLYGYGGALQPERLSAEYLQATDDMPQVPLAIVGGRRIFHATGPVGWDAADSDARTRNPYSQRGCYFLSDSDNGDEPLFIDSLQLAAECYPLPADYHALYEVDDYAWFNGGRNLYDRRLMTGGSGRTYTLPSHTSDGAVLRVFMSYAGYCEASVSVADTLVGTIVVDPTTTKGKDAKQYLDSYSKSAADVWTFDLGPTTGDSLSVNISQASGADMRLDRIELCFSQPRPLPLGTPLPEPCIEGPVANQDLHSNGPADMVIVVPESGLLLPQAERLAQLHTDHDQLRVQVVRADQLYNEFSSGTPDANAYRRYLKMLRDRANGEEADMPHFLLLFGPSAWDNRMLSADWSLRNPADHLLCYESENSMSETACYVTDDFFGMLDEGEGANLIKYDKCDVAVGRLPARDAAEAAILVDKIESYRTNAEAGSWQNTICLMGDDGNANLHMNDAEIVAGIIDEEWPAYDLHKIYWDAYQRVTTSTGYAFPEVTSLIRQQMRDGALLMNYTGHGATFKLSHEEVIFIDDFRTHTSLRLPLWFTASCNVAPFDTPDDNIAQAAMLNPQGGAIAFVGTTRTVYAVHNRSLNKAFTRHLLTPGDDGRPLPIGEALRLAKNDQVLGARTQQQAGINRLHYVLLGDPALRLPLPTLGVAIDSINGLATSEGMQLLIAGDTATVCGHVEGRPDFQGVVTLTLKDAEQTIVCRKNPQEPKEEPKEALVYTDHPTTLFVGSDSVRAGAFRLTLVVPKDISYSDNPGLLLAHATNDSRTLAAHGRCESFVMGSADDYEPFGTGPDIAAWLDTPLFADGDYVSAAPHLHADLSDDDGINASGSGIGHDIELCIDGQTSQTYNLNSYFHYDFGDYRRGSLDFFLPTLADGQHTLWLRAWDVLNHSSLSVLNFAIGNSTARPTAIDSLAQERGMQELWQLGPVRICRTPQGQVKKIIRRRQ